MFFLHFTCFLRQWAQCLVFIVSMWDTVLNTCSSSFILWCFLKLDLGDSMILFSFLGFRYSAVQFLWCRGAVGKIGLCRNNVVDFWSSFSYKCGYFYGCHMYSLCIRYYQHEYWGSAVSQSSRVFSILYPRRVIFIYSSKHSRSVLSCIVSLADSMILLVFLSCSMWCTVFPTAYLPCCSNICAFPLL